MSYLERIPRKIIFLLLIIIITVPLVRPFPVFVPISDHTRNFYNVIDTLEPGSVVLIGTNVATRDIENYPMGVATLKHLKTKDAKIITYCFWADAAMGTEWLYHDSGYDKLIYGTDYVHLGLVPGEDAALSSFCLDMVSTKPVDHHGNPIADMPIFQNVKSIEDVDLVITFGGGTPGPDNWARIAIIPYNKLAIVAVTADFAARMYDYIRLGIFTGALMGQRGCVEYESITGFAGRATSMYAPIFLSHILLLILMVIGNGVYLYNIRKKEEG